MNEDGATHAVITRQPVHHLSFITHHSIRHGSSRSAHL